MREFIVVNGKEVEVFRLAKKPEEVIQVSHTEIKSHKKPRKALSETKQTKPVNKRPQKELVCRSCYKFVATIPPNKAIPKHFTCPHCNTAQPGKIEETPCVDWYKKEPNNDRLNYIMLKERGVIWDEIAD